MASRGFVLSSSRKRQRGSISVEEAKDAIKAILNLKEDDLLNASKVTSLPYPGVGRACSRPGPEINFVGRPETVLELCMLLHQPNDLLIFGAKGAGKSTDVRAVACIAFKSFAKENSTDVKKRLVFLWTELLLLDVVYAVKNALLFCFLVDEITGYENWQEVQAAIETINSIDNAVEFIKERQKQPRPEKFHFFVDGGEQLDAMDFFGRQDHENRSSVQSALKRLLFMGARVWWCTSPKASLVQPENTDIFKLQYIDSGFHLVEYHTYASHSSFLRAISDQRFDSIVYLTGLVPLFLEALCECCEELVREVNLSEERTVTWSDLPLSDKKAKLTALRNPKAEEIALFYEEDDNWDEVVKRFCQHQEIKLVRKKAEAIQLQGQCNSDQDMAKLDLTYVLNVEEGKYCSAYIKRLYMEQVRHKEDVLKPHADGAWMEYARRLLNSVPINWATLGHLCEDVLASVIQKKGLTLGSKLKVLGGMLTLQQFDSVPSRSLGGFLKLKANSGYYFKPLSVNFPHIDGVIVWVDESGRIHVIALQYTVNIDDHLDSADRFMSLLSLEEWFPDIKKYVGGSSSSSSSSSNPLELHYAFLGCSSRRGYTSGLRSVQLRTSRTGMVSGIPQYELHIQPFDDKAIPGLQADDYKILLEITSQRSWKKSYADVCKEGLEYLALKRTDLEKLAKELYGIDGSRSNFRNKALLINAMVKAEQKN